MAGYQANFHIVETIEQLRSFLLKSKPDVIISCYETPEISCFHILGCLKDLGLDIPFLVLSTKISQPMVTRVLQMGANDFITKDRLAKLVPVVEREVHEQVLRNEKRVAEKALQDNEKNFKAILDNSPVLLMQYDHNNQINLYNQAFVDVYGNAAGDLETSDELSELWSFLEPFNNEVLEQGKTIKETFSSELTQRVYLANIFPIADHGQKVETICAILSDITEKFHQERQMLQMQKMDALGKLTSGVAHDFNNLLTIIQGTAEILEDAIDEPSLQRFVRSLLRATNTGAELTKQLLAFSRFEKAETNVVDLSHLVNNMRSIISSIVGPDVVLDFQLEEKCWPVLTDTGKLENAILNLAINSRDALEGDGKIIVKTGNVTYQELPLKNRLLNARAGKYSYVTISDNGHGIPEAIKEHIFDPFFTTKEKGRGTGLGLATLYSFMNQYNGFIMLDSKEGQGTSFGLYFPLIKDDKKSTSGSVKKTALSYDPNARIMVVEDQEDILAIIVAVLQREGFQVESALNAETAYEMISKNPPDLVLSDIMLTGPMKGNALVKKVVSEFPDVKVCFMSGFTRGYDLSPSAIGRNVKLLKKPFKNEKLIHTIQQVLAERI